MNWEIIGATGEWVGAIVFLLSILYLAKQINVASLQFEKEVEASLSERAFQAYDPIYQGRNGEIMQAGLDRPDTLNESDLFIFDLLMHRQLGVMHSLASHLQKRHVSEEFGTNMGAHYQHVLFRKPGANQWARANAESVGNVLEILGIKLEEANA